MGSPVEVLCLGEEARCADAMDAAFREIGRVERLLSVYRPDSEVSRINRFSRGGALRVDPEVLAVLSKSIELARLSGGAFDPTSGPLIRLWGFGPDGERCEPPSPEEILSAREKVGFEHLKVHPESGRLEILKRGVEVNLGGVGKGYALDRAAERVKSFGITRGMIGCGSTIVALGAPPGEAGWQVRIRDPRQAEKTLGALLLRDQVTSTSGDYERFFLCERRRFHHLIDPRTGCPREGIAGATVIAPTAMEADALSTAAFILGETEGRSLLESLPGVEGLIIKEEPGGLSFHPTAGWPRLLGRRRFLAMASLLLLALFFRPARARAAVVYLTEEEALRRMMPEAGRFETEEVHLSAEQLARAQQLTGKAFRDRNYRFRIGKQGDRTIGYATVLEVIGKERPITFLIGIDSDGSVIGIEVLIYRESEGSEIRHARFRSQFFKKRADNPLRLGDDIQPITGATLSSRAAAYAVRKTLSLFQVIYGKN